ncbi:hypothetical protein CFC21_097120 [Triticum aestivum]|uniref:Uncharacterized protein n=2 Tax=Triticum aestivum TaxID=4565 RepID=A0A3B6RD02_WHEAT|nr:hypothetical protein CFC21_097120 [Triticum aestivum]
MAAPTPLRHVAMLPFMAKGHAMPLLHLARLLLGRRLASAVTFFTNPHNAPFIRAGLVGAGAVDIVELPFPSEDALQSTDELPSSTHLVDFVSAVEALGPAFADALTALEPRPDLLVHDGFIVWAKDVADELGIPRLVTLGIGGFASYIYGAVMTHALVRSPTEPFPVPGLPDLRITKADLSPPFDDPEPAGPHWDFVCQSCSSMYSSSSIIANSFSELESMWAIRPLCLTVPEPAVQSKDDHEILDWLDSRLAMDRPVLYVAFGSQAELSRAQLEEIAVGLDHSGVDFLWVVRSKWFDPKDRFSDRFGDRGKVVEGFINQLRVLSHKSVSYVYLPPNEDNKGSNHPMSC